MGFGVRAVGRAAPEVVIALLDTHSFLWAAMAPEKLSAKARDLIGDPANAIHLSTVSLWEISLKFSLGELQMTGVVPEELVGIAHQMDLGLTAPTPEESAGFHRLPRFEHGLRRRGANGAR